MTLAQDGRGTDESRPAGPVGAGDPPPLPVAKASSGEVPPTPPPAGGEQIEQDLDALLASTQRERDEYLDLAKRTKADFENFRKRISNEIQIAHVRGKSELLRDVVPVLDDLERAFQAAGIDPDGETPDGLAHGVQLVFRSLRNTLSQNGVETLDPKGQKFDPMWHEALSTQPSDDSEPGTVLEVLQKGYQLDGQLIRPARVVVAE